MILIALALTAGLHSAAVVPPDTARTIFGHWHFNKAESDDPHPYLGGQGAGSYGSERPAGGGGRGGAGMGGSGMGGSGTGGTEGGAEGMGHHGGPPPGAMRTPSAAQQAARQELAALAVRAPTRLDLSEAGDTLTVVSDSAAPISLRTDGHKVKWITADSVKVETHASWKNGRLVVEHDVHDAGKVAYTFYLSPDGIQLFVAVEVYPTGGPTRPVPFRRVYDPVVAGRSAES
jgi:hypothetical protein